jgi:F-type H+-transporting ATPase subunit delta
MDQPEKIVTQLIKFLRTSGKIDMLPEIIQQLENELKKIKGENTAIITSSKPLSPQQLQQLEKRLLNLFGKKLEIINRVDPEVVGGFVIQVSDKIIDLSLQNYFEQIEKKFEDEKN